MAKQLKILVVDDDEVDRMAIRRALAKTSFSVSIEECETGEQAFALLGQSHYSCVFLDYRLPGLDGLEVLRRIRAAENHLPVVMLTGQGGEQIAVEMMKAGATDYLIKERMSPELFERSLVYAVRVFEAEEEVRNYQKNLERLVEERTAELKATQNRLIDISRKAGMADVATSVLHNMGNILNNVKVAANLTRELVRRSKISGLTRAAELLSAHKADLPNFLLHDPRGTQLPGYLQSLSSTLEQEQGELAFRLDDLGAKIGRLEATIALQQSYARAEQVVEVCKLEELIEDAIVLNDAGLKQGRIEIKRTYDNAIAVRTEKHKLVQILINLISNAVNALENSDRETKEITIVAHRRESSRVRLSIADNGEGIAPENLTKIFQHGFTTRKNGHGFGLHSSALAAGELGGSLFAESDGLGKGACFVLEMPFEFASQKDLRVT